MEYRNLGRTGLRVSTIGFGAFKIGRNQKTKYGYDYPLPDEHELDVLLNGVLDLGINVIDTVPAYGLSEERIGRHIANRRHEYVLSTKVGEVFADGQSTYDFSQRAVRESVHRSLQRLRTDVLDIVLIHSSGEDDRILDETDVVSTLKDLRGEGVVRAIGLSGKSVAAERRTLDWADVIMTEYHLGHVEHAEVIEQAELAGIGVIVKKGLASGSLDPSAAIPFVLQQRGVSTMIIGGLNLDHVLTNIEHAERASQNSN